MQLAREIRLPSEPEETFSRGFPLSDGKWFSTYAVIAFVFILIYCNTTESVVKY